MRYWLRFDGSDYTPSLDDMTRFGYLEVTKRSDAHEVIWMWDFDASVWIINPKAYLVELAKIRYTHEIVGITYNGKQYDTDDRARISLIALITYGQDNNVYKLSNGDYEDMTLAQVKELFNKVMEYTLACFHREKDVKELTDAGNQTVEDLDAGWPNTDLDAPAESTPTPSPVETNGDESSNSTTE